MKTFCTKPGFEFIFSLSLIAIIALPLLVFAQGTKNMEIKITNGDTVINGKNIKELSPDERKQALKDLDNLGNIGGPVKFGRQHLILRKRGLADTGTQRIIIEKNLDNGDREPGMLGDARFKRDTDTRVYKYRMNKLNGKDSAFTFNYRLNTDPEGSSEGRDHYFNFRMRGPRMEEFHHRNVQSFEYNNTGTDGISTHVSFRVNDPSPEKIKAITGSEKAGLEIKDLALVPEFSAGKTVLMFSLLTKAVADVKLTDTEGKTIWSDKVMNGSFNKSFTLGLNGVYFLQVKQGGKAAVKRIVKEE